ncbi:MAG: hypothetical protein D6784_18070, partial [Chloroflexi bacterium]
WRGLTEKAVQTHLPHFRQALTATLLRVLNGLPAEDIITARCGKVGYALDFLEHLASALQQAKKRADYLHRQAPEGMQEGGRAILALIQEEEKVVQQARESLQQKTALLLGESSHSRRERQSARRGLLDILREQIAREKEWRESLRQIPVRRTLADEKIFDALYQNYFAPHLTGKGLEGLYWRERKGELELALAFEDWQETSFTGDEKGREALLQALLELAETVGQEVWQVRLDAFFDDEETGLWHVEQKRRQEAEESCAWAEPTATVRPGMARQQQPHRYLWVNQTVQSGETFARQIGLTTNMRQPAQQLPATDPYSATLITSLDILPLSALTCTERLETEYRATYRVGQATDYRTGPSSPEPVHVFAAEQNALRYEQRLAELYEPPRLFHPLFVAALEDLEKARYFVLAWALGWVQTERFQERGEWRQRYVLLLPAETQPIPLTRGDRPNDPVALLVRAMQSFVLGHPREDVLQTRYSAAELAHRTAQAVEKALKNPQTLETLPRLLENQPDDLAADSRIGANDFWSFARLVVSDELKGRSQ